MADGSHGCRPDPKRLNDLTFSASFSGHGNINKCSVNNSDDNKVKLSFYTELEASESCEKSASRGVAASSSTAVDSPLAQNSSIHDTEESDDRKKRCFDRYDSSESSDSGVVVLSPTESSSGACSGSDITEPGSPRSPESSCGATEDGAAPRMPPWASEPAPAGPRRPPPAKRPPQPPVHRRITEYFNHKMKPHNGLKRDSNISSTDGSKRKCLPKNGVTQDLEKYISYLSQTLSPRVMHDMDKQTSNASDEKRSNSSVPNSASDSGKTKLMETTKITNHKITSNGFIDYGRPRNTGRAKTVHANVNGLKDGMKQHGSETTKEKKINATVNGMFDKKQSLQNGKLHPDPSANGITNINKHNECLNKKVPISANDLLGIRIAPALHSNKDGGKVDSSKINGIINTTTKLDSKMNGVTCGSNNLSLKPITPKTTKKEPQKKPNTAIKRTNRKSSACIANSKNLTWSKANNLKQVQLQNQNCVNSLHNSPTKNITNETTNAAPKINIPNGVRSVPMMNGNINGLNMSVPNLQSCHQINLPQAGTVNSTNLASFVAMPQNVMLTTLRIPQNGITAQTVNQHNSLNTFNRTNVGVTSPTKLNGQFVFPFVQNINGTVVQIPNLMAKVAPNFVLPQTPQLTAQRTDHSMQTQQAQILINGTLLKLASNTMTSNFTSLAKPVTPNVSIPGMNKTVAPGIPSVGMTVQSKSNFTVNISHPLLVSPPGFIVNSVPNISVKETWSNVSTTTTHNMVSCANPIVQHPPPMSISNQTLHSSSSIPIAPVKPPDKPNQALDPPNMLNHSEMTSEIKTSKCDIPWLAKTVNNNNVLDPSKLVSRPFAQFCSLTADKLADFGPTKMEVKMKKSIEEVSIRLDKTSEEIRRVEEVARREETIFTQITVLKDVSSNVHNTVIEANYSSPTNESSESGIGTDKSIDSPSDLRVSKECDDDSSLCVSVCSVDNQGSQKSPILKQPKTIRFPPRSAVKTEIEPSTSSTEATSVTVCLWEDCKSEFENDTDLLEHLQAIHVESQTGRENYVCLWAQCKVRGKPSCSRLWLERHALSHGGNKPFKCIVDGCGRRFSTQILLERHVNNHFNEQSPNASNAKKTADSAARLIKRNGKKLRYRRQPWSARMFDFFDPGIMEGLAWRLMRSTRWRLGGRCPLQDPRNGHTLTLRTAIAAARYNAASGTREALVTYYPPHILEDEWVPEKDVKRLKIVEISKLPTHTKVILYDQFCASYASPAPPSSPPPSAPSTSSKPSSPAPSTPGRVLPVRQCTSSRLLNNLIAKQKESKGQKQECRSPLVFIRDNPRRESEVSGAAKRKIGRRYGGNAFWPCGR